MKGFLGFFHDDIRVTKELGLRRCSLHIGAKMEPQVLILGCSFGPPPFFATDFAAHLIVGSAAAAAVLDCLAYRSGGICLKAHWWSNTLHLLSMQCRPAIDESLPCIRILIIIPIRRRGFARGLHYPLLISAHKPHQAYWWLVGSKGLNPYLIPIIDRYIYICLYRYRYRYKYMCIHIYICTCIVFLYFLLSPSKSK